VRRLQRAFRYGVDRTLDIAVLGLVHGRQ
jgi:hypothetical protein